MRRCVALLVGLLLVSGFEAVAQEVASRPVVEVSLLSVHHELEVDVRTSLPVWKSERSHLALRASWISEGEAKAFAVFGWKRGVDHGDLPSSIEISLGPGVNINGGFCGALTGFFRYHRFSGGFEVEKVAQQEDAYKSSDLWAHSNFLYHFRYVEVGVLYHRNNLTKDFAGGVVMFPLGGHNSPKLWGAVSYRGAVLFGLTEVW